MSELASRSQDRKNFQTYCIGNVKKFLSQTSLHALKYVGDDKISFWERSFFLCSFIGALITTANLIANIYAKWNNTPVIIGISPQPTSILDVPFPAITVCNMNQVLRSKVSNYSENSPESELLRTLCFTQTDIDEEIPEETILRNNTLEIEEFVFTNCSEMFRDVITDEGLCCVFNVLHPKFLYQRNTLKKSDNALNKNFRPVDWNPETGYEENLSPGYYPRRAFGTGVSMGLSIIIFADVNEYYCSTTNGPGFKVSLHNPIETPDVKEAGLTIPIGFETRFRIDAVRSEAAPTIRAINRNSRQCLFKDEEDLLFYKYYTRRNCESECEAMYFHKVCQCIPFNLPRVYENASLCNARDILFCINKARRNRADDSDKSCLKRCLPSCFDLTYLPDSFSSPLALRNYTTPNILLQNMSKTFVANNIAVIHFYYKESVFYGDLKNVYIGLTEFLSNTGGIMGLFMGFSVISVVEIFYFALVRPAIEFLFPLRKERKRIRKLSQWNKTSSSGSLLRRSRRQTGIASKILKKYKLSKNIGSLAAINRFPLNRTDELIPTYISDIKFKLISSLKLDPKIVSSVSLFISDIYHEFHESCNVRDAYFIEYLLY